MKIGGTKIEALSEGDCILPREGGKYIKCKVRAFPLGEEGIGEKVFPDPVPPSTFAKDSKGMPLFDNRTGKPIIVDDIGNPEFLRQADLAGTMQLVVTALSVWKDVEFEEISSKQGTKEWYLAAYEEMKKNGITRGDIGIIINFARDLSNLNAQKVQQAAEAFSSGSHQAQD